MHKEKAEKMEEVRRLSDLGLDPPEIAERVNLSEYTVHRYYDEMSIPWKTIDKKTTLEKLVCAVTRADVERYKKQIKPGDMVTVVLCIEDGHKILREVTAATVISVNNNVILTNKGCFQTKEVYIWSRSKKP